MFSELVLECYSCISELGLECYSCFSIFELLLKYVLICYMHPDKCRIGFILEARHPIIIKVNSKQKSYYLNTDLV